MGGLNIIIIMRLNHKFMITSQHYQIPSRLELPLPSDTCLAQTRTGTGTGAGAATATATATAARAGPVARALFMERPLVTNHPEHNHNKFDILCDSYSCSTCITSGFL